MDSWFWVCAYFFVRTSNDKLNLSDKSAIVADRTSSSLVSYLFNVVFAIAITM